nr:1-acyl-sn-glycerol-3-phosphate acyltransferase [Oceanicoccus sp. KOV_DT_Chl]
MAAAPHTSNWDFALLLLVCFSLRLDAHWMGKDDIFMQPFKRLMIWLGGIPIDRSKKNNVVEQMVNYFQSVDNLIVIVPPEGTRSKVERWRTGFYHIALNSELPIVLGFIDAANKKVGFGPAFVPTGNVEQDMQDIQSFYQNFQGINPENF